MYIDVSSKRARRTFVPDPRTVVVDPASLFTLCRYLRKATTKKLSSHQESLCFREAR